MVYVKFVVFSFPLRWRLYEAEEKLYIIVLAQLLILYFSFLLYLFTFEHRNFFLKSSSFDMMYKNMEIV